MIRVCLCYNTDSELLASAVKKQIAHYPELTFESYNEDLHTERKKAFAIKGNFAARATPFCGILDDNTIKKGFYTEAHQCTEQQISEYLFEKYAATRIELSEEPDEPQVTSLDTLINNYKQAHNHD